MYLTVLTFAILAIACYTWSAISSGSVAPPVDTDNEGAFEKLAPPTKGDEAHQHDRDDDEDEQEDLAATTPLRTPLRAIRAAAATVVAALPSRTAGPHVLATRPRHDEDEDPMPVRLPMRPDRRHLILGANSPSRVEPPPLPPPLSLPPQPLPRPPPLLPPGTAVAAAAAAARPSSVEPPPSRRDTVVPETPDNYRVRFEQ